MGWSGRGRRRWARRGGSRRRRGWAATSTSRSSPRPAWCGRWGNVAAGIVEQGGPLLVHGICGARYCVLSRDPFAFHKLLRPPSPTTLKITLKIKGRFWPFLGSAFLGLFRIGSSREIFNQQQALLHNPMSEQYCRRRGFANRSGIFPSVYLILDRQTPDKLGPGAKSDPHFHTSDGREPKGRSA